MCGHSSCCTECVANLHAAAQRWALVAADEQRGERERTEAAGKACALCPTCRAPVVQGAAEVGEHVGDEPTFVMAHRW